MDLKDFMQALLDEAKLNPNALADRMGMRRIQSVVERITEGKTLNPRRATIEPVAAHFGVPLSAFYDPEVADQIAALRGWQRGRSVGGDARESVGTSTISPIPNAKPRASIQELAVQLASALLPFDPQARKAAASLLADLAIHPESGATTAAHLGRLLGEPGNAPPPGFTSFHAASSGK